MNSCSICFEDFCYLKEECIILFKKFTNLSKIEALCNPKNIHICHNNNCNKIICNYCWVRITSDLDPDPNYPTLCPFCRTIDWKEYKNTFIHTELLKKVLGQEGFKKYMTEQLLNKFMSD